MKNVMGKKILITGAAMGLGKLYAQLAVKEGAGTIVLWDINAAELEKTVAELKAKGGNVKSYIVTSRSSRRSSKPQRKSRPRSARSTS